MLDYMGQCIKFGYLSHRREANALTSLWIHGCKCKIFKILNFWNSSSKTLQDDYKNGKLNSVQKLCGTVFSQFPLLYVVIGPTSLWESYSWRPPLISPSGSHAVRASGKALISWEKSENSEMRPQTKSSWRWLPHKKHQYSSICFTSLESIFKLLKCNTPFTRIFNVLITS